MVAMVLVVADGWQAMMAIVALARAQEYVITKGWLRMVDSREHKKNHESTRRLRRSLLMRAAPVVAFTCWLLEPGNCFQGLALAEEHGRCLLTAPIAATCKHASHVRKLQEWVEMCVWW